MYNKLEIENAEISFERDLIFVFLNVLISAILLGICAMFYKSFSSWFFLLIIPSGFFPFHTLWILLNPFAKIYKNRIEIRPTFFRSQIFYFNDIQQLKNDKKGKLFISYKDGELEPMRLVGIRKSSLEQLKTEIEKKITH